VWEIGGFISGAVLIAFGAVAIYLGADGYQTVRDELNKEYIVGGSDMSPDEIKAGAEEAGLPESIELPTCDVVDEEIDTGSEARCFAQYMRVHALEGTGGLSYAQMGRYQSAANPDDPAGTSDEAAAAKDEEGQPISNGARNTWITETALATALNVSYMAQQISVFGIVVEKIALPPDVKKGETVNINVVIRASEPTLARVIDARVRGLAHIRTVPEAEIDQFRTLPLAIQLTSHGDKRVDLPFQIVVPTKPHARPGVSDDGHASAFFTDATSGSISTTPRAKPSASRTAPWTWGMQRRL